jgi:hypothetical protein
MDTRTENPRRNRNATLGTPRPPGPAFQVQPNLQMRDAGDEQVALDACAETSMTPDQQRSNDQVCSEPSEATMFDRSAALSERGFRKPRVERSRGDGGYGVCLGFEVEDERSGVHGDRTARARATFGTCVLDGDRGAAEVRSAMPVACLRGGGA